ncbi:hypothetical protein [Streptomyces sp. NBC_01236]|uniref:hypothetical protein n=1 Tax=Streptomyces sp. NBC_01236 TaxID=2903789 RepID=UPI002E111074|nr:hypothetical protein OG324_39700 [Streptomyces sp. NBC_01236]
MNGYTPRIDDLVWDEATRKVGQVMGHVGPSWQLRPPGGGREWDASIPLRPATAAESLSAGVALANARSRGELP